MSDVITEEYRGVTIRVFPYDDVLEWNASTDDDDCYLSSCYTPEAALRAAKDTIDRESRGRGEEMSDLDLFVEAGETSNTISNKDDIIDSRDVIARIEEIEGELEDLTETDDEQERADLACELEDLNAFMADMCGRGGDEQWRGDWYPVTIIRDSYFKEYAVDLAEELDLMPKDARWPATCIDWDQAARELQMDYTCVEFDGVDYWVR